MGRHRCLPRDGDPGPVPRVARNRHRDADPGRLVDFRGDPRARFNRGDAHRLARILDVSHRTTSPERGRVHPDRPQVERALPCEPALPRGVLRRDRGRHARRVPAPEPVRPRHPGDPSPAVRRRLACPGRVSPGGGIRRHVRLRNLLGSADGSGALTMAVEVNLGAQPQKGHVLAAWGLIGWRWIWRSPAAAIVPLLQPFFFLYFLHLISDPSYFPLQVAGAMIFSTQNIGSWCLSDSAVFRIELRLQDIFVASPHDKLRYLIGVAFSNIIPALPALVALGIILATVTSVSLTAWLMIVACILIIWVLYSAIGIAVSSRLRSQREVWPVGNLIFTLLGILSPLYYPLSRLPPVWRELAQLLPATYAALLVQGVLGLEPATPVRLALHARLLILSAALRPAPAWWLYQRREP